jgi:hypothetical protein
MKKRWALVTIAAGLVLGVATPLLLFRSGTLRMMHTVTSCMLLGEAEKAGYLDKAKRATLVEALTNDMALPPAGRESAANLTTGCFPYP